MGGTWISQNKELPGVYVNFKSDKPLAISLGDRGVVALPIELDWGEENKLFTITPMDDTFKLFGYPQVRISALRESLKNATQALVYRINSGTKATAEILTGVTATAQYTGERGNDISVVISSTDDGAFDITTFVETEQVDVQTISSISDYKPNGWVVLSGEGELGASTKTLTGGSNTLPQLNDYQKFLEQMEVQFFNTVAYMGDDSEIKQLFATFVHNMRENEGIKVQTVLADYTGDYEGIINVGNGVILENGEKLSANEVCAWVAGATAGARINQSITNQTYGGAIDVYPRMTTVEKEKAVKAGKFLFTVNSSQKVTALYDINSLTTYTTSKSKDFRKNRVIRALDNINNDVVTIFESNYMGKVDNNNYGRSLFKASLVEYFNELQRLGAIQNFENDDVIVSQGIEIDAVVVDCYIQPVDSAEKFYMTVTVK